MVINSNGRAGKKEKRAVLQLLLIIVSFFIGYIPFTGILYSMSSVQTDRTSLVTLNMGELYGKTQSFNFSTAGLIAEYYFLHRLTVC